MGFEVDDIWSGVLSVDPLLGGESGFDGVCGWEETAGAVRLVRPFFAFFTYSDWKSSARLGTIQLRASIIPLASLYDLPISVWWTSRARRGAKVIPRSVTFSDYLTATTQGSRGSDDLYSFKKCIESFSYS